LKNVILKVKRKNELKKTSFDVDSVLLNTEATIIEFIKERYNTIITQKDIAHWNYYSENFPEVIKYFANPDLYKNATPVEGMQKVMKEMLEKYDPKSIQLVTSSHRNVEEAKNEALKKVYGHIPGFNEIDIIHVGLQTKKLDPLEKPSNKNYYTKNTNLVDDTIHNIEDNLNHYETHNGILVDFGYGWNQNYVRNKAHRVNNAEELLTTLLTLLKEKNK